MNDLSIQNVERLFVLNVAVGKPFPLFFVFTQQTLEKYSNIRADTKSHFGYDRKSRGVTIANVGESRGSVTNLKFKM